MENVTTKTETFFVEFDGPAFDKHEISAAALAQSLLALDGFSQQVAREIYGRNVQAELKVSGGFRPGSFIVDLCFQSTGALAATVTAVRGVIDTVKDVVKLGKWAFGEKVDVEAKPNAAGEVRAINKFGQSININAGVVNIYSSMKTRTQLSRFTQTLDIDGVDKIKISGNKDSSPEEITKDDRKYFRHEEGIVLTDNETEVILEVIGPMLNGTPKGWTFSEGEDGITFTATVEDNDFLEDVKSRKIRIENGTSIRAVVRVVQRKNVRTKTDRTIVEVKEVIQPDATPKTN